MKRERWNFYKATQYRSSWRSRAKKYKGNVEEVPTRQVIEDWLDSLEPFKCYITLSSLSKKDIEADHIQPIARGGSYSLDNIGLTSKRLNGIKGSMTLSEIKGLLELTESWEDRGDHLFSRLLASNNIFRRRRK